MLTPANMERLNELAKKKKEGTITAAEIVEQQALRKAYLRAFKESMKTTLAQTKIIDPKGRDVTPEKVKALRIEKRGQEA